MSIPDVSKTDAVSERHHEYIWRKIQEGCYCAGCLSSWAVTAATRHQVTLLWVLRAGRHTKDDAYRFVGNPKVFQHMLRVKVTDVTSSDWTQVMVCWNPIAENFWVGLTYLTVSISRKQLWEKRFAGRVSLFLHLSTVRMLAYNCDIHERWICSNNPRNQQFNIEIKITCTIWVKVSGIAESTQRRLGMQWLWEQGKASVVQNTDEGTWKVDRFVAKVVLAR